jgi:hypothetical protein
MPCRNRYLTVLFATAVPACAIIIWLTVISIQATSTDRLFPSFILGICVLGILYVVGWLLIPELRRAAKLEELLSDFIEISDKFTRPRIYVHRLFAAPKEPKEPKDFAYLVGAKSDGTLLLPRMVNGPASIVDEQYGACINLGDELFTMHNVGYWDDRTLLESACRHLENKLESVHVRITPHNKKSNLIHGDFTIEGNDAKAFLETLKLVYLFKRNRNRSKLPDTPLPPRPPRPQISIKDMDGK